ncbi:MAG: hypothetical protein OEQ74_05345, partial [Gammaproteobacteria bacterium]|nr:hypothetical protein [Gammaproteobacteria bacterium]
MNRCQIARRSRSGLFHGSLGKLRLEHRAREAAYGAFFSTVFLLCQSPANSLAIDDIRVLSRLGEPLRAEIVVTPAAGEVLDRGCFSSTRASGELPGIDRVSLSLSRSLNGHVIGVTSARPMREPMSEFVMQVKCPGVPTMIRNFLVMVDPPTVADANASAQAATLTSLRTTRAATRSASTGNIEPGSRYMVRHGDMLSTIASRVAGRPDWSVWPIAQQIYASNPGAFLLGDPNMISEGSTIYIPQLSEVDMRATARV